MSDIDDELLALAGGASSDEEEDAPVNVSKGSSGSPNRGAKKAGARKQQNDSEEEGEASSANSPNSLRSAPMDQSDSESDAGAYQDDDEKYPIEGKFKSENDKSNILSMPEIKREEILAERAQEVERDRQSRALKQLLKAREADSKQQDKKRKAGAADLEQDQRKTARQRTKVGGSKGGESSTQFDILKKARAEKNDRQRRREEDRERDKDRRANNDQQSSREPSPQSEVEWDAPARNKKSITPDLRDTEPVTLHDIERVRVGRGRFAMVCFYPGFDEAITGCFVRISIGTDVKSGQNLYRMAIIKGFVEDRPYALENENGKPFKTTQYVRAAHGASVRNWPFITCSNSPFTEAEFNRYKQTCLVENIPMPSRSKLSAKITDINDLVNRSWTDVELQEKLIRSGAISNRQLPVERNRISNEIKDAIARGDTAKEEALRQELAELEGPKLAYSTSMHASPKKNGSQVPNQQDRLAKINIERRRKNAEDIRRAQIAERRLVRNTEAAIARGEDVKEDTSRRVKTKAKFKHDVADSFEAKKAAEASGANTPVVGTPTSSAKKSTVLPHIAKLQAASGNKKGIPTIRRPMMDDDIIGSLDLDIDIDLEL